MNSPDSPDPQPIRDADLRELQRTQISDPKRVKALLLIAHRQQLPLRSGLNPLTEPLLATLDELRENEITLRASDSGRRNRTQHFFSFDLSGTTYFFVGQPLPSKPGRGLSIRWPEVIYEAERRDRARTHWEVSKGAQSDAQRPGSTVGARARAELAAGANSWMPVEIVDRSDDGLGLKMRSEEAARLPKRVRLRISDDDQPRFEAEGIVRNMAPLRTRPGWTRVGMTVSQVTARRAISVQHYRFDGETNAEPKSTERWTRLNKPKCVAHGNDSETPRVRTVDYRNSRGERIRAIADTWGETRGASLVVIPPAWGRTKETLLPLARIIVETFRAAGQPVVVLRFDGIRRRGESHNDPDCIQPGRECLRSTLSQAIDDIHTTLDFAFSEAWLQPSKVGLVTSSVAAIEGRRAIVSDPEQRINGWVSLVGIPDLQSSLRIFSGGIDYASGIQRGLQFGQQELLGVLCDMDRFGPDGLEQGLWFLEDARRDLARIDAPITWIHGRYDAWMQLDRVRDILSCGEATNRQLIDVPTGHQLRTSESADTTFGLVASEIFRMLVGHQTEARCPRPEDLERRRAAERRRLPIPGYDLRRFWRDYLVGRRGELGIELLTNTRAYRDLQDSQIRQLELRPGDRVVDLGAGTGAFPIQLSLQPSAPPVDVILVDFVAAGLARAHERLSSVPEKGPISTPSLVANLNLSEHGPRIPLQDGSANAVLASLLIGYLEQPALLLREIYRVLEPGGRLVLSSVLPDADLSKIYVESLDELPDARIAASFGEKYAKDPERLRQDFLNDASRILDLEEFGVFRFWSQSELCDLVRAAGFTEMRVELSFGSPPLAAVVRAQRN